MPKTTAALGFHVRTGRAAVVALAAADDGLEVVAKRRFDVATTFEEGAVYHMGAELPLAEAIAMISSSTKRFERAAKKLVGGLVAELTQAGYQTGVAGVGWGSSKPLPPIEKILGAHPLIHTAEGALYRQVFATGSEASGLRVVRVPSQELEQRAAAALGVTGPVLAQRLAAVGKASGRPWAAEQKLAALAAIVALREAPARLRPAQARRGARPG